MKTRMIGKSGIEAGMLGMGAWAIGGGSWWGENDDTRSIKTVHRALELGCNWIDTAAVYGFGHSEEVVGKAIHDRRDTVVLSSKCGLQWRDTTGSYHFSRDGRNVYRNLTAASLRKDLEESLRRLQTDYIDIFYTHWQAAAPLLTPMEETMGELLRMKEEGKIRAIGASNVTVENMEDYLKYGALDVIQEKYSMLDRRVETELLPFCEQHGITLQTYSPLEQGLLTGKVGMDYVVKPGEVRDNRVWWNPKNRIFALEMLASWNALAEKYHCPLGNLVIAWTAAQSEQINVLCGARKVEQVEENCQAGELVLEPADLLRMTADANSTIARAVE